MNLTFDRDIAEQAIEQFLEAKGLGIHTAFESRTPGVVAMERIDAAPFGKPAIRWDEMAAFLARTTGVGVVCIANADWSFDDDCDDEATLFAFDVPDLDPDYRDDPRNQVAPVSATEAMPPEAFEARDAAEAYVAARLEELTARMKYLREGEDVGLVEEKGFLETIGSIGADETELVAALNARDITAAVEARTRDAQPLSPAP